MNRVDIIADLKKLKEKKSFISKPEFRKIAIDHIKQVIGPERIYSDRSICSLLASAYLMVDDTEVKELLLESIWMALRMNTAIHREKPWFKKKGNKMTIEDEKSSTSPAKFFKENSWIKIENAINPEVAKLLYHHIQLSAVRLTHLDNYLGFGNYNTDLWGSFTDKQAPGDFSRYGDPIFDALLNILTKSMENFTGLELIPTYSYHRLYTRGTELTRHKDRPSCEISTTLCLGYDNSNIDDKKYPNWSWPMFVGPSTGEMGTEGLPIKLNPGDMIIYKGCEIEHWREPLMSNNHAQVFLHYNEKNGKNNILYDGRTTLGLPKDETTLKSQGKESTPNKNQIVY